MNHACHLFPTRLQVFLTPHHQLPFICKNMRVMVPPDSEPDRKYLVPVVQPTSREEKMACKGERRQMQKEMKKINHFPRLSSSFPPLEVSRTSQHTVKFEKRRLESTLKYSHTLLEGGVWTSVDPGAGWQPIVCTQRVQRPV